jgi:competence protein ComEC
MLKSRLTIFLLSFVILLAGCSIVEDGRITDANASKPESSEEAGASENDSKTATTDTSIEEDPEKDQSKERNKEEVTETAKEKPKEVKKPEVKTEKLDGLKAHYIDVGQADATLLEYSHKGEKFNILIDSGNWNSDNIVDYLKHQKITHLDIVIGTHPHSDHIGQIDKVISQFEVEEVWLSGDTANSQVFSRMLDGIDNNDIGYYEPRSGDVFDIGPLVVEVFSPKTLSGDLNNGSISFKATYGTVSFLFTGDAEKQAESGMLNGGHNLKSTILSVGHHGSNTSTTKGFLDAVNPSVAIISAGANNQYGHPDAEVVNRIENKNIDLYSTIANGTIIVSTDGTKYDVAINKDGTVSPSSSGSTATQTKTEAPKKTESKPIENKATAGCVNINEASFEELQKIIHIGPARAEDVINSRPFDSVESLTKIKGIAAGRLGDILSQGIACVGG